MYNYITLLFILCPCKIFTCSISINNYNNIYIYIFFFFFLISIQNRYHCGSIMNR